MMSIIRANVFSLISNISLRPILCTVIITLIFKYIIDKCRRDQRLEKFARTLPGPFALPIIGNSGEFFIAGLGGFQNVFQKYSQKYGTTYRFWLGKYLVVAMSDVNDLEVVFKRTKLLGKPEVFRPVHDFWGNGLFTAPMAIWKTNRKRLQPIFAKNVVKFQISALNRSIENYVQLIKDHVDGPEFDISTYLPYLAVDSIVSIHFDLDLSWNDKKYFNFPEILKISGRAAMYRIFIPWLRVKFIGDLYFGKQLKSCKTRLRKFFEIVNKPSTYSSKSSYETTELEMLSKSFLPTLHALEKELGLKNLIHDEISVTIGATSDTIATTNAFLLLAISMNPEIQDRLYDEIFDVFGEGDRPAGIEDIQRLSYLDQVVKETERRFTLAPAIFRDVEEDSQIGSLRVPVGSAIMVRVGDIHLNPDFYPNPYKFNPDNFSPEAVKKRSKYSFIPFSAGARDCIGKTYADTVMKLTIVALLRNYTFYTTTKMENIEYEIAFLVTKSGGYKLGVKLRDRRPSIYKK